MFPIIRKLKSFLTRYMKSKIRMTKRLLFIAPMFPLNEAEDIILPFPTHFTQQFAETTGVEVHVMALMFPQTAPYKFGNITVYPIGSGYKKSFYFIPYFIKAIFKGIQLHRKNNYDGVLCFWYRECTLIGKAISKIFGIKLMVWMLGQDVRKDNKYLDLLKINPSKLIMLSSQQRDIFYKNHKIWVEKIANVAIDTKRFPEFNQNKRNIDILGVGNLTPLKNYSLFLEIIYNLKSAFPNIHAIICGDDSGDKELLLQKAKALGIEKNVFFTGSIPHKEVLEYMNDAKVFLHTSKFEGGGAVLQEALYSGCKVVSTIDIETQPDNDSFYYSLKKEKLIDQIDILLKNLLIHKRIENFRMEDSIHVVYDSFYG